MFTQKHNVDINVRCTLFDDSHHSAELPVLWRIDASYTHCQVMWNHLPQLGQLLVGCNVDEIIQKVSCKYNSCVKNCYNLDILQNCTTPHLVTTCQRNFKVSYYVPTSTGHDYEMMAAVRPSVSPSVACPNLTQERKA